MGKAAGLGVIPEFVIRAVVPRVRGMGRAATLILTPRVAFLASRGRFVLRRRGSREAAGLIVGPVPIFSVRRRAALPGRRARVGLGWVLGDTTALVVIPKFVGLAHRVASHHRRSDEGEKSKGGEKARKGRHGKKNGGGKRATRTSDAKRQRENGLMFSLASIYKGLAVTEF